MLTPGLPLRAFLSEHWVAAAAAPPQASGSERAGGRGADSLLRPRPGVEVTLLARIGAPGQLGMEERRVVRRGPQLGGGAGPALPAGSAPPAASPHWPTAFPSWWWRRHGGRA